MGVVKMIEGMTRDLNFLVTIVNSRSIRWWDKKEEEEIKAWVEEIKGRYAL